MTERQRICDYGDATYRQDFWEGQGRNYEDAVERRLLRKLLPERGRRLLEIGAGFGRITDEYAAFDQVVLLDYSLEQLQYARGRFGDSGYLYIAADAYRMPFLPAAFDAATMIRVIHHFENVPAVLRQVRDVLAADGNFILEFANKRHLKSMLRHLLGLNRWNPYTLDPVEFVELNFNFHPGYVQREVERVGFDLERFVPVSWFRLGLLKRTLPIGLLSQLDALLQRTGWTLSPSIFYNLKARGESGVFLETDDPLAILKCPQSGTTLHRDGDILVSETGIRWGVQQGVLDFRQPLS